MSLQSITRHPLFTLGLLCFLVALAVFLPRLYNLDGYVTVDEPDWLMFASNFYYLVEEEDYAETLQIYHPGVINLWIGAFVWQRYFPDNRDIPDRDYQSGLRHERDLRARGIEPLDVLWRMRLVTLAANTILLVIAFALAQKLFGRWPAFVGALLIAFDPHHLGLTRLHQIDGLLSGFFLVAVLAMLVFVLHRQHYAFLILSGVSTGLAFLTKSPALFLLPVLAGLLLWGFALGVYDRKTRFNLRLFFTRLLFPLLLLCALIGVVYYALFPAMWAQPWETVAAIYGDAFAYAGQGTAAEFADAGAFSIRFRNLDTYARAFALHTTPVAWFGVLAALGLLVARREPFDQRIPFWSLLALLLYGLGYILFMSIGSKSATHYILPSYLPLDLAAGIGLAAGLRGVASSRFERAKLEQALRLGTLLIVAFQALAAVRSLPYNYTYENPAFVVARRGLPWPGYGYGEGLERAGQYLADKPNAEALRVMAWYGIGPLSYYFPGETSWIFIKEWSQGDYNQLSNTDYLVTYINQYKRDLPHFLLAALESETPETIIYVQNIPYAYIYKMADLSLENFDPGLP
jgi:4-amino-4-deoxy-L-arabinose transferase-like glycosyltransferase